VYFIGKPISYLDFVIPSISKYFQNDEFNKNKQKMAPWGATLNIEI